MDVAVVEVSSEVTEYPLERWRHKPTDFVGASGLDPLEVLAKSRELVLAARGKPEVKMTVGDLSFATEEKMKHEKRRLRVKSWLEKKGNKDTANLSVGDLSIVADEEERMDAMHPREEAAELGLTVGSLYVGESSVPESKKVLAGMYAAQRKKRNIEELVRRSQKGLVPAAEVAAILRGEVIG